MEYLQSGGGVVFCTYTHMKVQSTSPLSRAELLMPDHAELPTYGEVDRVILSDETYRPATFAIPQGRLAMFLHAVVVA